MPVNILGAIRADEKGAAEVQTESEMYMVTWHSFDALNRAFEFALGVT